MRGRGEGRRGGERGGEGEGRREGESWRDWLSDMAEASWEKVRGVGWKV